MVFLLEDNAAHSSMRHAKLRSKPPTNNQVDSVIYSGKKL